jgi:hypothetical protein
MTDLLQNRWAQGKVHFEISSLPQRLMEAEGIIPFEVMLDPDVGPETALLLLDPTPSIQNLARMRSPTFNLKAGVVRTSECPLLFLLFYFLDPADPDKLYAGYDNHVNPFNPHQMNVYRKLARQTHWHLILVGASGKLVDLYEFENIYNLEGTLNFTEQACAGMACGSFDLAKEEFLQKYSIEDLFLA